MTHDIRNSLLFWINYSDHYSSHVAKRIFAGTEVDVKSARSSSGNGSFVHLNLASLSDKIYKSQFD